MRQIASAFGYFIQPCPALVAVRRPYRSLLTPCWQQAFDRKGAGKLTGFRLLFERE